MCIKPCIKFSTMKPTTSIYFDTRRIKADNKYPLKLRITHFRERKYYSIGIDLTLQEWEKVNSPKPRGDLKKIKAKTIQELGKADSIMDKMEAFSFLAFEKEYLRTTAKKSLDLTSAFDTYIAELTAQQRINSAESYRNALTSLTGFRKQLLLTDITPEFLNNYEKWMLQNDKSITTVGIYLRSLRSIANLAIKEGLLKPEQYPFGRRMYQIPTGQNIKKSLTLDDIARLYYYETETGSAKDKARDFWIFSYLANGINFKDICRLKFGNIHNDTIVFHRAKTERTKRSKPAPILVIITEDIQRIIGKWGNTEKHPYSFVFPILSAEMNAQVERRAIKQFIKTVNKWLSRIAKETGIQNKVTTYTCRHSFSTILKNEGVSIQYIKESLGHNSTQTTENYLNAFPDDIKRKFAEQLTSFKDAS